jgi:N-acyl-phosphatidylethanolamine-hydrolysing phospholipase D
MTKHYSSISSDKQITMSMAISDKIAKRVAERNSWNTYDIPTVQKVCKLLCNQKASQVLFQSGIPSQEEIDQVFPISKVNWNLLRDPSLDTIQSTWIGHATMFVQMGGWNILTDPIFSKRCSAVQFAGPERYRLPACTIKDLYEKENVRVDVVLVSHNHYDHLDYNSVKELAERSIEQGKPVQFVVPLGLKAWFEKYVPGSVKGGNQVTELDWHETYTIKRGINEINITGIPMQHWSNRNGFDRDKTLWCGFKVATTTVSTDGENSSKTFLFSGDTGFFDGLYDIGEKYGPFDLAAIPIGAYEPRWFMREQHTNPEDAVKMMDAVRAKKAFPIHWGTFLLTIEPILEPRERLYEAMIDAGKDPLTFLASFIGETVFF